MPIVRYVACVGTLLLVLLFVANWFLPQSLAEPSGDEINRPLIRIASVEQPPERIVIDTSLPTMAPPPTLVPAPILVEQARPSESVPLQSYAASAPTIASDRKRKIIKRQGPKIAANKPPLVITPPAASGSTAPAAPATRLSFADIVSGQLVRDLFNLH
jgi:hypothetical protein